MGNNAATILGTKFLNPRNEFSFAEKQTHVRDGCYGGVAVVFQEIHTGWRILIQSSKFQGFQWILTLMDTTPYPSPELKEILLGLSVQVFLLWLSMQAESGGGVDKGFHITSIKEQTKYKSYWLIKTDQKIEQFWVLRI